MAGGAAADGSPMIADSQGGRIPRPLVDSSPGPGVNPSGGGGPPTSPEAGDRPADLVAAWYRVRVPGLVVFAVASAVGAALTRSVPFWLTAAGALGLLVDALCSGRRRRGQALLSVWLDATATAAGLAALQVPNFVLAVPFLYLMGTAAALLPRRQALLMWGYDAVLLFIVKDTDPLAILLFGPAQAGEVQRVQETLIIGIFMILALAQMMIMGGAMRRHHETRQAQLEDLLRSKDEFLAGASHALRTPLTCVIGFGRLMERNWGHKLPPEAGEMLAELNQQGEELARLVDDLLVRAEDSSGRLHPRSEPTDLREIAAQVVRSFAWLYPHKLIRLRGDRQAMACADPIRVRQIVRDLISNAVRHGGDLIVVEAKAGTEATLAVNDNGPGLPAGGGLPDLHPFERCHPSAPSPSMGLGLPVSQRLAQLMGGQVTYKRADRTTTFTLTLIGDSAPPGPDRQPATPAAHTDRIPALSQAR